MLFSCCSSQCECDDTCTNKSFQHRPLKKTKLIKTEKCGHGLVAEDEIKKGEFVIEYVGEVIDDRTCENRLWTMKRLLDTDFYLCEVSSNMVIDATNKGNRSRFINHSCEPNTAMQKWTVDGETRVGIFALRDIKIGEELTYDYKFVQFGAAQVCHCGSSNCRKMLGTTKYSGSSQNHHAKKKKRKTSCENCIQQFLRLWHPHKKMYVGCWIIDFDQETKMHTLKFNDLHTEKFNLKEEEWHFLEVDFDED
ncbi:Histone-lysine N-methyltransferase ASHH3 [Zea mays]|nr:Histone-lysine N-methyltransferase ASHH3 [Zea mays]ONM21457.1 Histone-lysine N-methyltransferase ASHH3 [Zea mays]ONM21458.1 Histone-lysine N-methyltransferase ASHH3 [Zea mays]